MGTHKILIEKQVTDEQIDDILADAFYTAISYWCGSINVLKNEKGEEFKGKYASDALTKGHSINFYDAEEDRWRKLTMKRMLKALGKVNVDLEDYDSMDVDAIIQTALFGEVIYG